MSQIVKFSATIALLFLAGCGGLPQRAEVRTETPARVEIRGGGGAEVLVDGTSIGTVPAGQRSYRLNAPSGVHRLTVRKDGAVVHDSTVFFNDGTTKVIKVGR